MIVAITGAVPELVPVNAAMFPEPDAANPIAVLLFVQVKVVVPVRLVVVKLIGVEVELLQIIWLTG